MKFIKHYEEQKIENKYLIVDFIEHDDKETNTYIFEVDTLTENYMKLKKFYQYYNGILTQTMTTISYDHYDSFMKILYQTNSEKKALEKFESIVKIYLAANKYNL